MNGNQILETFQSFQAWVTKLIEIDESNWQKPISEGKWSVSQIVSHLMYWDHYLLSDILPAVRKGEPMLFPEFDSYNQKASAYVDSGVSQSQLIREAVQTRDLLVTKLTAMPVEQRQQHLTVNGVSHCPLTGHSYSLAYIVEEFIQHDYHHKQQIEAYWQVVSSESKKERKA